MKSIFGLPTHVLVVHLPVVLVPVAAAVAIMLAAWRRSPVWLRRAAVALTTAVALATWLATATGNAFDEVIAGRVPTQKHKSLGQTTFWLVLSLAMATGLLVGWRQRHPSIARNRAVDIFLAATTTVVAVLSVVWVVRTGHEGARITWDGVIPDSSGP